MSERWLPVVGYEGRYEVSDFGRVRSLDFLMRNGQVRRGRELKAWVENNYARAGLCVDRRLRMHSVHRLVLTAFVGSPPPGTDGCHSDGDPLNNRLANLRWGTKSENSRDTVKHGTHRNTRKTSCPSGHEYTPENTYIVPTTGYRQCRACIAGFRTVTSKGHQEQYDQEIEVA